MHWERGGRAAGDGRAYEMETLIGFCPKGKGTPTVGRLVFCGGHGELPRYGAFLSVVRGGVGEISDVEGQMGVILVGSSSLTAWQMASLSCPILMLPQLPERCMGQIGVIDPSASSLIVSPDLSTITRYAEHWNGERGVRWERMAPQADGSWVYWEQGFEGRASAREKAWLVDLRSISAKETEEGWYEICCDLADVSAGTAITVMMAYDRHSADRGAFRAGIRGIFRAAVYGRFSILVCGCLTESDIRTVREELHGAFCELECEGREFNGYIPKGILIDRPIVLASAVDVEGVDFLCLDLESLFRTLTGVWEQTEESASLWCGIETILSQWLQALRKIRVCGLFPARAPIASVCGMLFRLGIRDWLFLGKEPFEVKQYLRELEESFGEDFKKIFREKEEKISKST